MKTLTALLVTTFCAFLNHVSHAQNDCNIKLSLFSENVKNKKFVEAAPQLAYLRENCATVHYAIYALGEKVYDDQLKQTKTKQPIALKLIQLYKDRIKFFPEKTEKGTFLPKIGETMLEYHIGTLKEQYDIFDEAFTTDAKNFQHPRQLYWYFELYYKMYKEKTYNISLEDILEKYEKVSKKFTIETERLSKLKDDSGSKNIAAIAVFLRKMTDLVEKEATCETLLPIYQEKFKTYQTDIAWLRKTITSLASKGCKNDPLFIELTEAIDVLEPTAKSKLWLYEIHKGNGNKVKSNSYLDQYFKLETDADKKVSMLNVLGYEAANEGEKLTAQNYYLAALKINPSSGKSYLNLANLYGSSANECGTDEFSKRAIYWKAAEMATKAAQVDSSVKSIATKLIPYYMERAPSAQDIFIKSYKGGEKIPMNCWVGGYVVVPKL